LNAGAYDATRSASTPRAVDNTDWLKTAAIILVTVDHIGHFFIDDDRWWSVFGRLAAPTFFFLMGYATTRTVPLHWVWLGIILTLLNSWNAHWTWVAPNILLSLALIRMARPHVQILVQHHGWTAFALLVCALLAVLPAAANIVDYGAEGWLWALFGLCQRTYVDGRSATGVDGAAQSPEPPAQAMTENAGLEHFPISLNRCSVMAALVAAIHVFAGRKQVVDARDKPAHDVSTSSENALMRLLACFVAAVVYIWQEQREYSFPQVHFAAFILGVGVLSTILCLFRRGPSRIQPPEATAGLLRFIGRHTLEIYAIQLAGSELIIKLLPDLAP
jgi:hypothetical protein